MAKVYQLPYLNIATKIMIGALHLADVTMEKKAKGYALKIPVFSFDKFLGVNKDLGPEMKSTGESILFLDDIKESVLKNYYAK
mgnify:CR=1 FL=1